MSDNQFLIARTLEIDAAHRVPDHKSKCFNIHGHRYVIDATCIGPTLSGEQEGMVMDFGFLKQCMIDVIHDPCDHGAIFYFKDPMLRELMPNWSEQDFVNNLHNVIISGSGWKFLLIDSVPTAENLAKHWHERLQVRIDEVFESRRNDLNDEQAPKLKCVDVYETPNCVASYPA